VRHLAKEAVLGFSSLRAYGNMAKMLLPCLRIDYMLHVYDLLGLNLAVVEKRNRTLVILVREAVAPLCTLTAVQSSKA
jgi:hypothetical protein